MKLLDVMTGPWAIVPAKFAEVQHVYLRHVRGESLSVDELVKIRAARTEKSGSAQPPDPYQNVNGVAVIPIEGVLGKKMNLFMDISGGTSTQMLGQALNNALQDPAIQSILLYIDSPGGAVDGTQEVARLIYAARGEKPIVAYTDGMMASAAYWIGAAADQIFISGDTVEIGSIGVVATHVDVSKAEEVRGTKTTEIVAGKFKRVSSSYQPLSDIGRATIQEQVDHLYSVFVQDVATFRGASPETVIKDMADGRIFLGGQAITNGLVDGQQSFDGLLTQLAAGAYRQPRRGGMTTDTTAVITMNAQEQQAALEAARSEGFAAGQRAGTELGVIEGAKVGAENERARIKAVHGQFLTGHQALVQELMFDGVTTGPDAAMRINAAEQTLKQTKLEEFHAEAATAVSQVVAQESSEHADRKVLGEEAQGLVVKAKERGETLSYAAAMQQIYRTHGLKTH